MTLWLLVLAGTATGAHAATWGAHKDSPFEGFRRSSFLRSVLIGAVAALALWPLLRDVRLPVAICVLYTAERLATEWWKTIVRDDDQSAYTIPMRLGLNGRPVDHTVARWTVGGVVALGFAACCVAYAAVPTGGWPWWAMVLAGGSSGWFIAGGGAWKDAPVEGFSGWKFLRSPVVATVCAAVLLPFTSDLMWLCLAAGGASVASIETYKTFVNRSAPGKFADKPASFADGARVVRQRAARTHAALWFAFAIVLAQSGLALH